MEKTTTATTRSKKNKILSFLPKTATVSFQNHPFSPGRDHKRYFSGPIKSMIPAEARIKSSNSGGKTIDEPTSPKISCMGQIKHKKKSKIVVPKPITPPIQEEKKPKTSTNSSKPKRSSSSIRNIFGRGGSSTKQGRKSDASSAERPTTVSSTDHKAPSLSQMKRFSSGRDALADFDWKYYSEREDSDHEEEEEDDDDVIIPHSAPILIGGGGGGGGLIALEPRKEINLWKRRTMDPPKPLQLNGKGRPLVRLN